jgi:transposase
MMSLTWGMRRNPHDWSTRQTPAMHLVQKSTLRSARAWRLKMALRAVFARAAQENCSAQAKADLLSLLIWARRSRMEPFKKLAATIKQRLEGVVRGMLDNRRNAYVEAMNELLQQVTPLEPPEITCVNPGNAQ